MLRTIQQAKELEKELDNEEVKVNILNPVPTDGETRSDRRDTVVEKRLERRIK